MTRENFIDFLLSKDFSNKTSGTGTWLAKKNTYRKRNIRYICLTKTYKTEKKAPFDHAPFCQEGGGKYTDLIEKNGKLVFKSS